MNKEKLQDLLKKLKYHRDMAKQHIAIVDDTDYDIELLEALLEP